MERRGGEHRQRQRWDGHERQVVGAADEREGESPWRRIGQVRDERQRGRQDPSDPDALEDAGHDERGCRPAGLDARKREDGGPDQVGDPTDREDPQAADPVDDHSRHERGRDLDQGGNTDDQPDLRIGDAGPGQRHRERRRESVEPGLSHE